MNIYFALSGTGLGAATLLHTFMGGRDIAQPLLTDKSLNSTVRAVLYYCWHLVTFAFVLLMASFIWTAFNNTALPLATLTTWAFSLWGIALAVTSGEGFIAMPLGWIFLPLAVLGTLGLIR